MMSFKRKGIQRQSAPIVNPNAKDTRDHRAGTIRYLQKQPELIDENPEGRLRTANDKFRCESEKTANDKFRCEQKNKT